MDFREPVGLVVVFRGDGERVEENQEDDQPVEDARLHGRAAFPPAEPIPAAPVAAAKGQRRRTGREAAVNSGPRPTCPKVATSLP